jgi:integrase
LSHPGKYPGWLKDHDLEPTSRAAYETHGKHIISHLGGVTLAELDEAKVKSFIKALGRTRLAAGTIGNALTVLREMCKSAVKAKLMPEDPTVDVKVKDRKSPEMHILTSGEYHMVMKVIPDYYALLVECLVNTGMRWGEAMGLKATDVTPRGTGYVIRVRRVIIDIPEGCSVRDYGKTANSQRDITISRELGEKLIASGKGHRENFVFLTKRGTFITRSYFHGIWKKAVSDAGIEKNVRVHDLRHTHASWLVNSSNDPGILVKVRDRLGHSDLKVTSRYLHAVPGDTDTCLEALDRAMAA